MRFISKAFLAVSVLTVQAATPFVAFNVDQANEGPFTLAVSLGSPTGVSQSFTPTANRIDALDLFFTGKGNNSTVTLPVTIRTSLNGPIIGATTVTIGEELSASASSPAAFYVTFTPFVPLTPGMQYFINVGTDGGKGIGIAGVYGNPYPGGEGYEGGFAPGGLDLGFRTYFGEPLPPNIGTPMRKGNCRNGGWKVYTDPRAFKNQGDCLQYFNNGK